MNGILPAKAVIPAVISALCVASLGAWRHMIEVPGTGSLNAGGFAQVTALSCAPSGDCAATGPARCWCRAPRS